MRQQVVLFAFIAVATCALVNLLFRSVSVVDIEASQVKETSRSAGQALIQKGMTLHSSKADNNTQAKPYLIRLHQELSPVRHNGKVVSHKVVHSGAIHIGHPRPQEFRVVYDTGSAHLIVPSTLCKTLTCKKHTRYDLRLSSTGRAINLDGKPPPPGANVDEVTIGFGTAQVHGRFVSEKVCLGPPAPFVAAAPPGTAPSAAPGPCARASVVAATQLSPSPFDDFAFDGILGLGLPALALSKNFSVFDLLARSGRLETPHFAFFMAVDGSGESSELAVGGHNPARLLGELAWVPLARTEQGYWQVELVGIHIDGKPLDLCRSGGCYGILDSGTSHLGVPSALANNWNKLLTRPAETVADCRLVDAPTVVFKLRGAELALGPRDYMRPLPLAEETPLRLGVISPNDTVKEGDEERSDAPGGGHAGGEGGGSTGAVTGARCTPKLLGLDWPRPVGPNVFILGAPMMQRYYTVFDWQGLRAGFGLARRAEG